MQNRLRHEIRHLRRLKQLQDKEDSPSTSPRSVASDNSFSLENFGETLKTGVGMSSNKDCPLFTFKQVWKLVNDNYK